MVNISAHYETEPEERKEYFADLYAEQLGYTGEENTEFILKQFSELVNTPDSELTQKQRNLKMFYQGEEKKNVMIADLKKRKKQEAKKREFKKFKDRKFKKVRNKKYAVSERKTIGYTKANEKRTGRIERQMIKGKVIFRVRDIKTGRFLSVVKK